MAYIPIATTTVGAGGTTSVTFSSIPQTYTDLALVGSARDSRTNDATNYVSVRINGDTSSTVKYQSMAGSGGAGVVYADSNSTNPATVGPGIIYYAALTSTNATTANTFGNFEIYFPNYTSSNYKSLSVNSVNENNATTVIGTFFGGMLFQTTSPITSIALAIGYTAAGGGGTFQQYSTFTLYGIKQS